MQQVLTDDVDFKVMLTFLEFYETLLAFVNFRLYHSIHVEYPPILDPRLEALAATKYLRHHKLWFVFFPRQIDYNFVVPTRASRVESQAVSSSDPGQAEVGKKGIQTEESELRLAQLQHHLLANEPGALMQLVEDTTGDDKDDEETRECNTLFKNLRIFLSREIPSLDTAWQDVAEQLVLLLHVLKLLAYGKS
ncbi:Pescadillo [Macleaya cordata]|uniref:Pescadillo n=1 Tax=Macleaya cordata TaxID=56857 RepID=A0A200Q6X1_MACCD|nr:Pescadillo [Macleaya cordata]